jgi:hypothetical protein
LTKESDNRPEEFWRERVRRALLRYEGAKGVREVAVSDKVRHLLSSPDEGLALRLAMRAYRLAMRAYRLAVRDETIALRAYVRTLKVYTDLAVSDKIPPKSSSPHQPSRDAW